LEEAPPLCDGRWVFVDAINSRGGVNLALELIAKRLISCFEKL
jgi:hypothetical protein